MPNLTRRSLLVLGGTGAAGLAVAGCTDEDDPRAEGGDEAVLQRAADAEAQIATVYDSIRGDGEEAAVGRQFAEASAARATDLENLGAGAAKASTSAGAYPEGAIDAQDSAIAAYRECVRLGSTTEIRAAGIRFLAQVSAEQATVRGIAGDEQSPRAFVTGLKEKPYVASEDDEDGDTTTSTTSSSSTSTTTEDGG